MTDIIKEILAGVKANQEMYGKEIFNTAETLGRNRALDQAWAAIGVLILVNEDDWEREENYNAAIRDALEVIEKLGGMDPALRGKQ